MIVLMTFQVDSPGTVLVSTLLDILALDILGLDILGLDILGLDILGRFPTGKGDFRLRLATSGQSSISDRVH